ncbi:MAG: hypothetical protein HY474_02135 [Candidatus Sungbacteria bacterium]|uniref:shikimate dehydrogenase (NADP(+)) n=1 Tax=Candidatus Sungiibacteriota bacterium TaxID=2750080 RepID=A0A932YW32_9BACT|nr:hypothetical protein [Candidatus Sungbacteria bacterium]
MTHPITELLIAGIIRIAGKPPGNPPNLGDAPFVTLPLIAADYPALTPAMWNAVYERFGMPDRNIMVVADPKHAAAILAAFRQDERYRGGGCGIGFKEIVLPHLDTLHPPADRMGAVNIVKKTIDDRLVGWNTDGLGFARSLEERFSRRKETLAEKRILLIGGGGSARPIAFALAERGAKLDIVNRTESKAEKIAKDVNAFTRGETAVAAGLHLIPTLIREADGVVSAVDDEKHLLDEYSTLGAMPLPATRQSIRENHVEAHRRLELAKHSLIVADIRLRGQETAMLRHARELGFETLDGKPMVINQGVEALWWLYGESLGRTGRTKEEVAAIMQEAAAAA